MFELIKGWIVCYGVFAELQKLEVWEVVSDDVNIGDFVVVQEDLLYWLSIELLYLLKKKDKIFVFKTFRNCDLEVVFFQI